MAQRNSILLSLILSPAPDQEAVIEAEKRLADIDKGANRREIDDDTEYLVGHSLAHSLSNAVAKQRPLLGSSR